MKITEKTERNKAIFFAIMNGSSLNDLAREHNLQRARIRTLVGNYALKYYTLIFHEALKETQERTGTYKQLQPSIDILREYKFEAG